MPRKSIPLPYSLEHLSILDETGHLDQDLEPEIADQSLLDLYRAMLLGRRFDQRLLNLQRQGRIGTFPPISGQEASQLGAVAAISDADWFVPSFRETAAELWRGRRMEDIILYNAGYAEGALIEAGVRNLPIAVPVGSQIPHAVGLGWSIKYRRQKEVVMVFFGDGATSEGDFHEGLNMAGVFETPVVFICQNNQWAISIPVKQQTRSQTMAQKALAYGMPGIQVDGNDVLAVYAAAREAVTRAREGRGPTLIECVTYRMTVHTTADDPKRYRRQEEVDQWQKRDPIERFQNYLIHKDILNPARIESMEAEIKADIQQAVNRAEERMASLGDPLDMFEHAYAQLPAHLQQQKAELTRELESMNKEAGHG